MLNVITSLNIKNSVCLCYTHSYLKLYPDLWKSFWVCDAKDMLLFYLLVKYISNRCFLKPQLNNYKITKWPALTWSKFILFILMSTSVCVSFYLWVQRMSLYVRICVFYYFTVQRESRTWRHTHTHTQCGSRPWRHTTSKHTCSRVQKKDKWKKGECRFSLSRRVELVLCCDWRRKVGGMCTWI